MEWAENRLKVMNLIARTQAEFVPSMKSKDVMWKLEKR
jgi:hypothetical protein